MLGRLLQSAASTFAAPPTARPAPPLESVTEESHTRELLYPEVQALRSSFNDLALGGTARAATARDAANYDDRGAIDLAYPSDVRILIAQDAHSRHHQPQILYDSRPAYTTPATSPAAADGAPTSRQHPRASKSVASPTTTPRHRQNPSGSLFSAWSPTSPRSPGADKGRFNFGDGRARATPYDLGLTDSETAQGRLAREAKEDVDALLGCMFGAPGFRLEPGTKLHILPRKVPDGEAYAGKKGSSAARPISSGGFQRKRTPLVRSTSAADVHGTAAALGDASDAPSASTKPCIMFTRLFTVQVPDRTTAEVDGTSSPAKTAAESSESPAQAQPTQVKQKKVPMYAIAVILQLPVEVPARSHYSHSPQGTSPLASSLNDSTPATSWRGEQSAFASFMEIRSHGPFDTVLNSHIPYILQHWNVVNRTLELLEVCSKHKLSALLEQVEPLPQLTPNPSPRPAVGKVKKPKPQSQQSVYVMPGCLNSDEQVVNGVEQASRRIIGALRTRRVVFGQGRWGAWREEARWVGRWAGGKEQNFFLYNFLTAFLGTHTEWLELLAPKWYRKRYAVRQRIQGCENPAALQHRTVICSADKMAARRLIFLLASFLPSYLNHYQIPAATRERDIPALPYGESPPQFTARPNRDSGPRRSGTQKSSLGRRSGNEVSGHMRSVSFSLSGEANEEAVEDDVHRSRLRRDSDVRSLRNPSLVAPGDTGSRKASMSTVTADTVQAVPHFSNLTYEEPSSPVAERRRPGSGGSMASFVLSSTLKRSESTTGSISGSGGRWGSVVSGFWSNRRDSSTDDSDVFVSSQNSPRKGGFARHEQRQSGSGLERMVEEAEALRHSPQQPSLLSGSPRRPLQLDECLKPRHPALQESGSAACNIPRPRKPERLPLKLSFNEDDGYLDIAMDKERSFSSSLASSFTSIRHPLAAPFPTTAHEHISPYGSIASDSPQARPRAEPALDVAGWLKSFQPDFVLQAVRPYDTLNHDVEDAMEHESLLFAPPPNPAPDAWTEVNTTLIANTARFTVERVRLFRRLRRTATPRPPPASSSAALPLPRDAYETRIVTEPVMDLDPTLTDAVERILALSPSAPHSRASSPPRNAPAPRPVPGSIPTTARRDSSLLASETPQNECRRAVLGALEDVAKSVAAERLQSRAHTRQAAAEPGELESTIEEGELDGPPSDTASSTVAPAPFGREPGRDGVGGVADGDGTLREGVKRWMGEVESAW